jgi:hypothetical protein
MKNYDSHYVYGFYALKAPIQAGCKKDIIQMRRKNIYPVVNPADTHGKLKNFVT